MYRNLLLPQAISLNNIYTGTKNRRSSPALRVFKDYTGYMLQKQAPNKTVPKGMYLQVHFVFYMDNKKSLSSTDLDNLIKAAMDALSAHFKFNDNKVWRITAEKGRYDDRGRTLATIEEYVPDPQYKLRMAIYTLAKAIELLGVSND